MTNEGIEMASNDLNTVRRLVRNEFEQHGCPGQDSVRESILLSNSNYVGHRFTFRDWSAVWKLDQDSIAVFESEQLLKMVSLKTNLDRTNERPREEQRRAA